MNAQVLNQDTEPNSSAWPQIYIDTGIARKQ